MSNGSERTPERCVHAPVGPDLAGTREPWRRTPIMIKPASFGVPQRVEALARATELGQGLVMELHSSHTEFYADPSVEVGKIDVYAPPSYKSNPEYVKTLNSPEDHYDPWSVAPEGDDQ